MTKKVVKPNLQPTKSIAGLWAAFCIRYPNEESSGIFTRSQFFLNSKVACPECATENRLFNFEQRFIQCRNCKRKIWLLAGTFFNRVRRFRPWLAAIWFIEAGVMITASEFARLLKVATSTALMIFKKLSMVIESRMEKKSEKIPSAHFSNTFYRRSRETPAGRHPREEETAAVARVGVNPRARMQLVRDNRANELAVTEKERKLVNSLIGKAEKLLLSLVSDNPISYDRLCKQANLPINEYSAALTNLELFDFVRRLSGDQFVLGDSPYASPVKGSPSRKLIERRNRIASRFIDFVRANYRGISRKYLQNYVALFWAYVDKKTWAQDSLMSACICYREIRDDDVISYVTPLDVVAPRILGSKKKAG